MQVVFAGLQTIRLHASACLFVGTVLNQLHSPEWIHIDGGDKEDSDRVLSALKNDHCSFRQS